MNRFFKVILLIALVALGYAWGVYSTINGAFPFNQARMVKKALLGEEQGFTNPAAIVSGETDQWLMTKADVVMAGDSITANARWPEMFPSVRIVNRGVGGDTITGLGLRVDALLAPEPKKLFLMIGINDIYGKNSPDYIADKYQAIVQKLAKHAKVYVQSTVACSGATCTKERELAVAELNEKLATMCMETACTFINLNAKMAPRGRLLDKLTLDGIHLNGNGFQLWRDVLTPYISEPVP
jgi:lysophospholipase L1-like esterase